MAAIAYWPRDAIQLKSLLPVQHHADVLPSTQVIWVNKVWLVFFPVSIFSLHQAPAASMRLDITCMTADTHIVSTHQHKYQLLQTDTRASLTLSHTQRINPWAHVASGKKGIANRSLPFAVHCSSVSLCCSKL